MKLLVTRAALFGIVAFACTFTVPALAAPDLDVTYIARLPRDCYFYYLTYPNGIPILQAGTENQKRWPAFGEIVQFQAHILNKGDTASTQVNCRWKVNGVEIGTGTVPAIAPGGEATATVNWAWNVSGLHTDHTTQTVTFDVDYDNQLAELYEQNNTLTDYLEGCTLAIYCEPQIYATFNATTNLVGTKSFEDWIQAQIKAMNANFARSTYPLFPNGCLERVRIDKIVISSPPANDGLADGRWQFTGDAAYGTNFANQVDGGLIHALSPQLGQIDLYNMPVSPAHNAVITPDGLPNGMSFGFGRPDLMAGCDIAPHTSGATQFMPEYYSSECVGGLNSLVGYRRGYYGEFMFDIPTNNYLQVNDSAGHPAATVTVRVFQGGGGAMPATPVSTAITDASGVCLIPNRAPYQVVTTATGHTEKANPFGTIDVVGSHNTLLIELSRPGGDFDYRFMSIIDFNLAYWGGHTDSWTYTINSRLASSTLPRITTMAGAIDTSSVRLTWPAVPGATGYNLYRASAFLNQSNDPNHIYENWVYKSLRKTSLLAWTDNTRFQTCRYAVAPIAADGTEGPLSNRIFAPSLINPWGIAVLSNNQRVILDPQNGFAYLLMDPDGVYVCNTGSEHDHVEYSHFVAIDRNLNRMLTAHPSDEYGGPHSIRVTDVQGNLPVTDYGTLGTGNGQFNNPCGVAVDDASRIYAVDNGNKRIEILNSGGGFLVAFGAAGAGAGQFNDPEGIAVVKNGATYKLYVCDRANHRVQILSYAPATNTVSYTGLLTGKTLLGPTDVAAGPDGSVFVTDATANTVEEFSYLGAWRHSYNQPVAPYVGNLSGPTGITVDNGGQVLVCDTTNKRVVTVAAARRYGDINCDGLINNGDIDPFILAITDSSSYALAYPNCDVRLADINGDGLVNNGDIDAFVKLVTGG